MPTVGTPGVRDEDAGGDAPGRRVGAGVDVGATSVHLLVGRVAGGHVAPLADESAFLDLGDAVDRAGLLGTSKRAELVATLRGYASIAADLGAGVVTLVATDPLRRAADAAAAVHDVDRAVGLPLHVLDPREEAYLTLLGVTGGRPLVDELTVIDVGGGSTEVVIAPPSGPIAAHAVRIGAGTLTARVRPADPPTPAELDRLRVEASAAVAGLAPTARPGEIVAVGGTASNLLRLTPAADGGDRLDRRGIASALEALAAAPAGEVAEPRRLRPARVRLLPAGAAILLALLERFGHDEIRVSEAGLREGLVLATVAEGPGWRDRLGELAAGGIGGRVG